MRVFSISAPEAFLDRIDQTSSSHGYSGRSDFVRAALRDFLRRLEDEGQREGLVTATITLSYAEDRGSPIARIKHDHADITKSMVHTHTTEHRCLEVLILQGPAERVRSLVDDLRGEDGADVVEATYV